MEKAANFKLLLLHHENKNPKKKNMRTTFHDGSNSGLTNIASIEKAISARWRLLSETKDSHISCRLTFDYLDCSEKK